MFGRVAGVFGKPAAGAGQEEDDSEIEALLQQISDARHAGDRRDAMAQLAGLLRDNPAAQHAMGTMGLPVLLSVLQEDRDDAELIKGALEALQLSMALPDNGQQQQQLPEGVPHPALLNADLYCRAPDNALLLLGLLRDDDGGPGVGDFYIKYGALQTLAALLAACPDKLQACVLSSPGTVAPLMDLLGSQMEVLRNEALLLLVGLCAGCSAIASLVAFEGGFERLLAISGSEGGPEGGNIVVQDAAELINHLLRGNVANQRLFREMGHISQLPPLLQFTPLPPPQAAAAAAAAGMLGSAGQYLPAAGAAAAAAAANSVVGAAAAAGAALWPVQVSANLLCLLETARLLLAAPHAPQEEQRAQEAQNRRANQDKLGQLGIGLQLTRLAVDGGGAPSAAVRAQALFCLADLVCGHPQLQEQLAGTVVRPPPAAAAAHPPPPPAGRLPLPPVGAPAAAAAPVPLLQAVLRLALRCPEPSERAGAMAVLQSFCVDNNMGQLALLSTLSPAADPHSVGGQLLGALLCQQPPSPIGPHLPRPGQQGLAPPGPAPQGLALQHQHQQQPAAQLSPLELQLVAGRAAKVLSFLLQRNPTAQSGLLGLQLSEAAGDSLLPRLVRLLAEAARHADGRALPACYSVLRLLVAWCSGCSAAVVGLLAPPSHLPLLVDLAGGRMAAGNTHTAGLAAVLLGVCLMNAPGSPHLQQQQQQQQPGPAAALPGQISFSQLLDILLNRVGLSQFFGAIDDMRASKAYAAARAPPQLPPHITRSAATAVLEAEAAAAAAGGSAAADGGSSGAWGLLQGALLSAAAAGGGGSGAGAAAAAAAAAAASAAAAMQEAQPYDQSFTLLVDEVAATVQQLTLNAFSGGGTGSGPGAAAAGAAGSVGGIGQQQLPLPGAAGGVPGLQQQQQHAGAGAAGPGGALAALAAQLQGETAEQKLDSALRTILQLQASSEELRARNRALAEDLIRLSQSKPHSISASNGHTDGGPADGSHPGAAGGGMNGHHHHQQQQHARPDGQSGPASTGGGGLADVESRVAAQLRASRAELELGAVRQQLSAMQARWSQLEADAVAARGCADEARAAAAKAEADLAALSSAYNGLEGHAFELEEQLRQLQQQQGAAAAAAAAGASEAEVQARIQAALEQDRQQRSTAEPAAGGEGGEDLAAALAAAAAEGRAAAEAEAGEEMEDLLACLGEEQGKVEVLSQRLAELGEDVEGLLADLAAAAAAEADEEQEEAAGGAAADELL